MKCCCGSSLSTVLFTVIGLGLVGVGGYNYATTGCPLRMNCGETCTSPAAAGMVGPQTGSDTNACGSHRTCTDPNCTKVDCTGEHAPAQPGMPVDPNTPAQTTPIPPAGEAPAAPSQTPADPA